MHVLIIILRFDVFHSLLLTVDAKCKRSDSPNESEIGAGSKPLAPICRGIAIRLQLTQQKDGIVVGPILEISRETFENYLCPYTTK